ncbi:hypothetical protein FB107DRAFT_274085 [Schizophyllum commune]
MNVPFASSGALSRRHYKLVSDVENAATMQAADQFLLAEINHIQRRARSADLSLKDWKENLILLLHCSLTISAALPMHALDFALPHAVTVAEAGESVPDKRIGYLFCAEVMSHDHELRLMLVNTIRKDLESPEIPRICLALDALITSPSHDVIPAVQPRRHDLLSHTSSTLTILNKIDGNIVSTYYVQSVETMPSDLPLPAREAYVGRLLEVIETQCYDEGEAYANAVLDLLRKLSALSTAASTSSSSPVPSGSVDLSATVKPAAGRPLVLESVVTAVLEHIRFGKANFRVGCATTFVASVLSTESESSLMVETFEAHGQTGESSVEPTAMVITAALATEFCGQLAMAPVSLLRGFSTRLGRCPAGVQDACLLAMLRISAECEDVPGDVLHTVQELARNAGRHIRRRCEQFTTLSQQPTVLRELIQRARSHSLPDFLEALQVTRLPNASAASKPGSSPVLSERSLSGSKLRYDAYEAPHPAARIRARRLSSGTSSVHSGMSAEKDLSRTVSPGQLTLMASLTDADNALNPPHARSHTPRPQVQTAVDDLASRVDLIAFDSPFIANPPANASSGEDNGAHEAEFERIWNALDKANNARGWCEAGLEEVVNRLCGLELPVHTVPEGSPPFLGELKIIVRGAGSDSGNSAALRLRANDSDGCLWRMRCGDPSLQVQIKRLLADG